MAKLKVGDLVNVIGQGTYMTIEYLTQSQDTAKCVWFDDNDIVHREEFPLEILMKEDD